MKTGILSRSRFCLGILALLFIVTTAARSIAASTNVYSTGFEFAEGYDPGFTLIGQSDWVGDGSGGNGLLTNFFPGFGQQAFIGFSPPDPGDRFLRVWRPINLAPIPTNTPIVKFRVLMEIVDSSNSEWDDFYWSLYNVQGDELFTLDFDNLRTEIFYGLEATNVFVSTEKFFTNDTRYTLTITMNFAQNQWSASLDSTLLVTNLPISTIGSPLNLGDIDAVWFVYDTNAPGNNYMLFDNYQVTAESATAIPPQVQFLGRTGDGQALLRVFGESGSKYAVEAATNLVHWTALKTNVALDGYFDFIDTAAPNHSRRFYRGRFVP